jgi:hypothetical protein
MGEPAENSNEFQSIRAAACRTALYRRRSRHCAEIGPTPFLPENARSRSGAGRNERPCRAEPLGLTVPLEFGSLKWSFLTVKLV